MGYNLNAWNSKGLCLRGEAAIREFVDRAAPMFAEEDISHHFVTDETAKIVRQRAAAVVAEKDFRKKVEAFKDFSELTVAYPFDINFSLKGVEGLEEGPILAIEYDIVDKGERWHEGPVEEMVRALAPQMKRGSFLGFIGEDMAIWSYVFDGEGSHALHEPTIDWTGGI